MRRDLVLVLAGTAILGVAFIVLVPAGLPYDEPAHWNNVLYYATHARMPELGRPGTSYEAQHGPLAYTVDALVAAPMRHISEAAAFYSVRSIGLMEHLVLAGLVWHLARALSPRRPAVATIAAVVVGLNPMFLAMSTSVQNDTLSLVLAVATLNVTLLAPPTIRRAAIGGVLIGLALLAKIIVWPIGLAVGAWLLLRRAWRAALAYAAPASILIGWWIARNYILYGDATGQAGVRRAGYSFPALSGFNPVSLVRSAVTYLWLPTEYVRNTVASPNLIDALIGLLTIAGCVGVVLVIRHRTEFRPHGLAVLTGAAVVAVLSWLVVAETSQTVAFRFAYAALPAWFIGVGGLAYLRKSALVPAGLVAGMLVIAVWFLQAVVVLPPMPFELRF